MNQYIKCIDCIVRHAGRPEDYHEQEFRLRVEEAERRANIAVTTISGNPVCCEHLAATLRRGR